MARYRKRGLISRLFQTLGNLILLGLIIAGGFFGYMIYQEHNVKPAEPTPAMVVLGAQVQPDGTPSVQLALRLEKALEVYQKHPQTIVVTGARGANEPVTEASVMKQWLIDKGVPADEVLVDDTSMNTKQNLANALRMLPAGTGSITIVTSDYHLPRAMKIASDMGLTAYGVGSPIKPEYWVKNHAREFLAWGKYYLSKVIPLD